MKKIILTLCASLFAAPAFSLECEKDVRVQIQDQKKQYGTLGKKIRRLTSRISGQDARVADLTDDYSADVPAAPEVPALPAQYFDDKGAPLIVCVEGGFESVTPETISGALDETTAQLDTVGEEVEQREEALTAAEDAMAAATAAAEAEAPQEAEPEPPTDAEAAPTPEDTGPEDAGPEEDETPEVAEEDEAIPDDGAGDVAMREPMPDPENPFLFRRVITLPENSIAPEPGEEGGDPLPVFNVLYVFEEANFGGEPWLNVGENLREESLGWIKADQTVAWSTMLVMQFNENPRRGKVLFYETDVDLVDTVRNMNVDREIEDLYFSIEDERQKLVDDPTHSPEWDKRLVAIEPEASVRYKDKPYLLPILDFRRDEFDDGTRTTLVQVAAIPAEGRAIASRDNSSLGSTVDPEALADGNFQVGIVFVMDTTVSMRPYIEGTKQMIARFYEAFEAKSEVQNVSYGLYAFRDNTDHDDKVGYVTEVYQELDPDAPKRAILSNLKRVKQANVSTKGFKEDGFAGIKEALEQTGWEDFDLRLVIMITDASSREGNDGRARYSDLSASYLATIARERNVAVIPVHLLTEANQEDEQAARRQYVDLAQGINSGAARYTTLDARGYSDESFIDEFDLVIDQIVEQVSAINRGAAPSKPLIDDELLEPVPQDEYSPPGKLAAVVANEIFRAQLESLARNTDETAPAFLAGWASDRDLLNRSQEALDVRVFLTRNQLSEMAKRLDIIVESYAFGGDDPGAFFNRIQNLAAEFSTDPEAVKNDEALAVQAVVPDFLRNLPYKSEMLKLNFDWWSNESQSGREEYIERLKEKRSIYLSLYDGTENWVDFGAGDPALDAYPIKLSDLP